ncbi:ATP-binding protein [Nocardia sp. NPDC059239]|uniref:ATP-binding protein n=1 Tax=unclassified Nocardia TaxID=2637762 RepID=UPI0036CE2737
MVQAGGDANVTVQQATPPPRPTVVSTLPVGPRTFLGRDSELRRIVAAASKGRLVSIHTIDGMPGIGKTTLAVHAAHQLAELFPDGRYFVELHAHTQGQAPANPADVLARLLTDLGIDPQFLPDTLEGLRNLWRDRLTDKRVLIVLDDAVDADQIAPLIPSGLECLTLVTSRRRLVAVDHAMPVPLDILDPDPAAALFITVARRTPASDMERAAVDRITRSCGFLPLAIVLLAARFAHHPAWTIEQMAAEFTSATDRLSELEAGQRAVRAAFDLSYRDLPVERQRLFRRLGLHPGPDTDTGAAAALADIAAMTARRELDMLYTDHLIEETIPGRYRLHDLLRDYAHTLTVTDPAEANNKAVARLLDYYQHGATNADRWLGRHTRPVPRTPTVETGGVGVREFGDENLALAWMRAERANLLACLDYTTSHDPARMVALTDVMAGLLQREGPWPLARRLHRRAAHEAERLGDRLAYANALTNLGGVLWRTGHYGQAIDLHEQALDLYREIDNRLGEGNALIDLAIVRQFTGDYDQSIVLYRQALTLYGESGERLGEGNALTNLGVALRATGDYAQAADLSRQALAVFQEIDNRLGEAHALTDLGSVCMATGHYVQAADLHQQALTLFREIGNRPGEGNTLTSLGAVRMASGDYDQSIVLYQQALTLYRESGERLGEGNALTNLAGVRRLTGDYVQAADLSRQALAVLREIGNRPGEARVLNEIGTASLDAGEPIEALTAFTDALGLARKIGSHLEQARALHGAARSRASLGDTASAVTDLRTAVDIYRRLRVPEANTAATYLAELESHPSPD